MALCDVFSPALIKIDLESEEKDEVFEELIDLFCQTRPFSVREKVLKALREREAQMSTGIQKGIAIPHGRTNAVDHTYGILGISQRGIEYDALDGELVHLIFMILSPQEDSERYIRVLSQLSQFLMNPQVCNDIFIQRDAQSIYKIIEKYEENL
ncbi:MAG: PTS sugar transporter subunit IIA [Spirochaetaceae bacterium]|jgi:PTS system fructose-specific IIC component/PTS system nitrogen regulatory IIA component|nr:PTS sugar transporter subunit IIA [Spirochaetaceae bacterium]